VIELDASPGAADLSIGDKVHVSWNGFNTDGIAQVSSISVLDPAPMEKRAATTTMRAPGETVGLITHTDEAGNRITLENGFVFKLGEEPGAYDLDVGDKVHISWNGFTRDGVLDAGEVEVLDHAKM
jgi:hypothetical protein